jgi:hypothetical protein
MRSQQDDTPTNKIMRALARTDPDECAIGLRIIHVRESYQKIGEIHSVGTPELHKKYPWREGRRGEEMA